MSRYKAIVIGSGAGGAPVAHRLAEFWGGGVAIVEAGEHFKASDFTQREYEMVNKLYAGGGLQGTEDGSVGFIGAKAVGGSTVINDAICFKPPKEMVERWKRYGVDVDWGELSQQVAQVEQFMRVSDLPRTMINAPNYKLGLGAARMGWHGERLRHNSVGCVQCGFRHTGCAYNAKQSMNLSFVPKAVAAGATLFPQTRALTLEADGDGWKVHTDTQGELTADVVVVCAGVVQTPRLLLASGIDAGQGVQAHLSTLAWGEFDEVLDPFNGIPMSYGVLEFADVYGRTGPGYVIEGVSVQPVTFSVQSLAEGPTKQEILERYRHLAGALCVLRSKARGSISLGAGGRPVIHYPTIPEDTERLRHFYQRATELYLAAGAKRVLLAHGSTRWVTEPPAGDLPMVAGGFYQYAAHQFGGACRGTTLDGEGRVKGQKNLWVLDASGFPEALGVNPQVTIAAVARIGAERILAGS